MEKRFYHIVSFFFGIAMILGIHAPLSATDWPTKDITLIVPYAAGGGYDLVARATVPSIEKHLSKKANVVVKNVVGAGGKIGLMEMVRARPDGYTIAVVDPADLSVLQVGEQIKDVDIKKFSWLGRLTRLPDMVVVSAKSAFKSPTDMKARPIRFAAIGAGVTFRSAVIAKGLGVEPRFISYDGTSPASVATMQGDIDAFVVNWVSAIRMVRASEGKLIPMFVVATERIPEIKDVPSSKELGLLLEESVLGYSHTLVAPPNLSQEVSKRWEEALTRVFSDPEWAALMNKVGFPPSPLLSERLTSQVVATLGATERFKEIITSLGIK